MRPRPVLVAFFILSCFSLRASPVHATNGHVLHGIGPANQALGGAGAAFAELFDGRLTVLTPTDRTAPEALAAVRALWEAAGARVALNPAFSSSRRRAAARCSSWPARRRRSLEGNQGGGGASLERCS